jgi:hypothetical protein
MNDDVYVRFPAQGGPSVQAVVPASGRLIVVLTAEASTTGVGNTAFMSVSLNGPGLDPNLVLDANSLRVTGNSPVRASITVLITGLTPGATVTFEAAYKFRNGGVFNGGNATFNARQIIVMPD